MDAQQAQAMQLIQQLAAQDPEIQILQQKAQFKAAIHEHTARCWEKCKLGQEAEQSSLSKFCCQNKLNKSKLKFLQNIANHYTIEISRSTVHRAL